MKMTAIPTNLIEQAMMKHESAFTAEPPRTAHAVDLDPHSLIELALISNRAPLTT